MADNSKDTSKANDDKEKAKSKLQKLTEEEKDNDMLLSFYAEKEKYSEKTKKLPKKGSAREEQTMAILNKFKNKLFNVKSSENSEKTDKKPVFGDDSEDDDDGNWMNKSLKGRISILRKPQKPQILSHFWPFCAILSHFKAI